MKYNYQFRLKKKKGSQCEHKRQISKNFLYIEEDNKMVNHCSITFPLIKSCEKENKENSGLRKTVA